MLECRSMEDLLNAALGDLPKREPLPTRIISFRLDEPTAVILDKVGKRNGVNASKAARAIIRHYLGQQNGKRKSA